MSDLAAVDLESVTVTFWRRDMPALNNVTFHVAPGEHIVVFGASGSGKSTLLQVITGVIPHTLTATLTGSVSVAGQASETTSVVQRARHLGVLAQDPSAAVCLPGVEQELALPLENVGTDPKDIGPRIDDCLALVGASHLRHRPTAVLSGGESQRVALAAALVTKPEVILLDEPTSMLDPAGVSSVRDALRSATQAYGPATVLVEHRLDEWAGAAGAAGLPARALVLSEDAQVVADGPTETVLRDYASVLHSAGCWLPLEAELYAVTQFAGGLHAEGNTDFLRSLAAAPNADRPRGDVLLWTEDLAVGRAMPDPKRKHQANGMDPGESSALIKHVNLEVRDGEVVAVLGANGIGKSTLLLTLAMVVPPLAGEVFGARPGLVFQNPEHQFVATTVRDEIGHGLGVQAKEEIVEVNLRRFRLTHLAEQNPFRLSGGEKRRLSLAAMMAHRRPVLLVDEPTLGLDRRDAIATAATLRAVAQEGRGVLMVSHDLRLVAAVADRVVILAAGGVLADGPTEVVLADESALIQAGLVLPSLVSWLVENTPGSVGQVLNRLDVCVALPGDPMAVS